MDFEGVKKYMLDKFEKELPQGLFYHSIEHTLDVINSTVFYAEKENIAQQDIILLKTAALFHDSGFLLKYRNNEIVSVEILKGILPKFNYNKFEIDSIEKMIMTTKIPQKPSNILEQILCDADLDYLGRSDFNMISIKLFHEWNFHGIKMSLKDWYMQEIKFLECHRFFTQTALKLRTPLKIEHINQIKELLGINK